jgi:hypothetical protein
MHRLVCLILVGCAPTVIDVKDRRVATTTPVGVDSVKLCDGSPFGRGSIDFGKDLKEAGIDLSQGCLAKGTFELVAEYGAIEPGAGCASPRGTVTLTGITLEAECTLGLPRQSLRTTCQANVLDVADGTQVFVALNACLDEVERSQSEPLRKLINTCKPTKFTFVAEGTCSADLCFKANVLFGVQTRGVVAQLGGTCP